MKRRHFSAVFVITLAAILLCAPCARAATLEVGAGKTYATIQDGINAANAGYTVLVYPGTYAERINFNGKAITVKAANGPAVTIINGSAGAAAW